MLPVSEIHFIHIDEIETSSSLNHDKVEKKVRKFFTQKSSKIFDQKSSNGEVKNSFFKLECWFFRPQKSYF